MDDVVDSRPQPQGPTPGEPVLRAPAAADQSREHFADNPVALAVLDKVRETLHLLDATWTERVTRSQVAFRSVGPSGRQRGFLWLWDPELYLRRTDGPLVVLTVGLSRPLDSLRIKESVHPSAHGWVHHLEIHAASELDGEVVAWIEEALDSVRRRAGHGTDPRP